ncbi:MAG: hypothetical protein SGI90_13055 [Candidatus Eisenbacteria bacterium]|nr:hypothetical protein [Candidatus Eisenbacteria bacterium]
MSSWKPGQLRIQESAKFCHYDHHSSPLDFLDNWHKDAIASNEDGYRK